MTQVCQIRRSEREALPYHGGDAREVLLKKLVMLIVLAGIAFAIIKMMNVETQAR